jgi:hypothetical protein
LKSEIFTVKRPSYRHLPDYYYDIISPKEGRTSPPPCRYRTALLSKVCVYRRKSKYGPAEAMIGWTYPEDLDLQHLVPVKTQAALEDIKKQMPECFDPAKDHTSDR